MGVPKELFTTYFVNRNMKINALFRDGTMGRILMKRRQSGINKWSKSSLLPIRNQGTSPEGVEIKGSVTSLGQHLNLK